MGGLASGLILAMEGKSVCILEKNAQIGGSLQTFKRDGVKFDTGVHYVGSLEKGQPLHRYFSYLGIMDDLTIEKMEPDGYDLISFDREGLYYPYAQGYDNFIRQLLKYFPEEREGLEKYIRAIKKTCDSFALYNLRINKGSNVEIEHFDKSAREIINSCTANRRLQNVLAGINMLYAGNGDRAPFYIHALIVNHYMQSAFRFPEGGDQIAKAIAKRIRQLGGKIFRNREAVSLHVDNGKVSTVEMKNGEIISGDIFISNLHPKATIALLGGKGLRKSYINRVLNLKNTSASFIVYAVLKEKMLPYRNFNNYHFATDDVWHSNENTGEKWGRDFAVFYSRSKKHPEYCDSLTLMTYMQFREVEKWQHSYNVRHDESDRGMEYRKFKEEKCQLLIKHAEDIIPGLRNIIKSYSASTPLTYRDYLNVDDGSIYGIERDFNNPLKTYINARTRLKNLFFTGQNLIMHGILGVTVGAVVTCSEILGHEYLMEKINAATQR